MIHKDDPDYTDRNIGGGHAGTPDTGKKLGFWHTFALVAAVMLFVGFLAWCAWLASGGNPKP